MPRQPKPTDFVLPVEGIGVFTFARRTMREQIAIELEYAKYTEGFPMVTEALHMMATSFAELKCLTVQAPDGWDIESMDFEDEESVDKIMKVWGALRDKLSSFRRKTGNGGNARPGDVQDGGVLVPPVVQAGAD